jgi:hypothetical protein
MAVTTRSVRRPAALFGAAALAVVLMASGCSSSKNDASSVGSTATSSAATTTTPTAGSTDTTASSGSQVTSPSTIPASVEGTCAALAETYGLDEIQPKRTISWVDERQRIVVDAQREAALLTTAQQGAPSDVAGRLASMAGYATWLATTMQGMETYDQAIAVRDAYPDLVGVSLAVAAVQTWQSNNCPD